MERARENVSVIGFLDYLAPKYFTAYAIGYVFLTHGEVVGD